MKMINILMIDLLVLILNKKPMITKELEKVQLMKLLLTNILNINLRIILQKELF